MKSLKDTINEAIKPTRWVAISVVTKGYGDKEVSSERVVSVETLAELEDRGYTKGGMEVLSLEKLCQPQSSRDRAMEYLTPKSSKPRKSKIDAKGADYIVYTIPCGTLSEGGKSKWGWNFWEEGHKSTAMGESMSFFKVEYGPILWGVSGSLNIGDEVILIDNDSFRTVPTGRGKIEYIWSANSLDEFIEDIKKAKGYTKPSKYAFGRVTSPVDWKSLRSVYSIKGVANA